jgi:DNA-binding response OmpR family regulator
MKTILLVEDEKLITETLERKLSEDGYRLVVSSQAEEGLEVLAKKEIDLVILDLEIVGLSAFSFLARKNNHPLWKKIPTLVISNAGEIGELSQAKEAGAVDWILKTEFSPEEISQKVKNIFQTKKTI